MAQTMVYTCDLCKKNRKSKNDIANITIMAEGIKMKGVGLLSVDVCPDCLKKKGFVVAADFASATDEERDNAAYKNKITLEDKIYEILSDLGVAFKRDLKGE